MSHFIEGRHMAMGGLGHQKQNDSAIRCRETSMDARRFSTRSPSCQLSDSLSCRGLGAAAAWQGRFSSPRPPSFTFLLVTDRPLPVPVIISGGQPFFYSILRAAGEEHGALHRTPGSVAARPCRRLCFVGFLLGFCFRLGCAVSPSFRLPSTSPLRTVSPSPLTISPRTPSASARTSEQRLVRSPNAGRIRSIAFGRRPPAVCLSHVRYVPSAPILEIRV